MSDMAADEVRVELEWSWRLKLEILMATETNIHVQLTTMFIHNNVEL